MAELTRKIVDGMLQHLEVSSLFAKRASEELTVHRQTQKRAADLSGELLKHLVGAGLVQENEVKQAQVMLGSHPETLQMLKNAADMILELKKKPRELGEGEKNADDKASDPQRSLSGPFVGRRTTEKKASDLAIAKVLN